MFTLLHQERLQMEIMLTEILEYIEEKMALLGK